jgi:hypothetical protein
MPVTETAEETKPEAIGKREIAPFDPFPARVQAAIDLLAEVRARRIREGRTQDVGRDAPSAEQ